MSEIFGEGDLKRIGAIEEILSKGSLPSSEEICWLCSELRRKGGRPDEFEFPEYAGIVNWNEEKACAVRYLRRPNLRRDVIIQKDELRNGQEILRVNTQLEEYEALMVVRPWVRAHAETSAGHLEELRRCTLTVAVDESKLVDAEAIDEFLIAPDGFGFRANPVKIFVSRDTKAFGAVAMDEERNEADSRIKFGCFITSGDVISVVVTGPTGISDGPLRLIAGLTAALYTTREFGEQEGQPIISHLRKHLSDER